MSDDDQERGEESGISVENVALIGAGIAAGLGLAWGARRAARRWAKGGEGSHMAEQVIAAARHLATPNPPLDYVGPGDDRWDDVVLGGLIRPGQWQWYQDGFGTTCAVFVDAALAQAGVDVWTSPLTGASGRLLLNYPEPRGVGFVPGAWQKRLIDGGRKLGIFKTDPDLRPGDVYCIVRDNNPAKWHVGIVLERNGNEILDASGGQTGPATATAPKGCQCAKLVKRTLKGKTLAGGVIQWRLTWP